MNIWMHFFSDILDRLGRMKTYHKITCAECMFVLVSYVEWKLAGCEHWRLLSVTHLCIVGLLMCSCGELTHTCLILQAKSSTLLPTTVGYTMNVISVKITSKYWSLQCCTLYKGNFNRVQNDINYSSLNNINNKLNPTKTDNQSTSMHGNNTLTSIILVYFCGFKTRGPALKHDYGSNCPNFGMITRHPLLLCPLSNRTLWHI